MQQEKKTKKLAVSGSMIALAAVLSMVKVWVMPLGGSVTLLSMLPIVILSIRYGVKWGFVNSFLYAVVQVFLDLGGLMSWGMTAVTWIGCLFFDYLFAYGSLGISGLFRNRGTKGIFAGIAFAMILRFLSHFISGTLFFRFSCPIGWNVCLYSICYNGAYMLPELCFTLIAALILFRLPSFQKLQEM